MLNNYPVIQEKLLDDWTMEVYSLNVFTTTGGNYVT
jgi:hypothetical protein